MTDKTRHIDCAIVGGGLPGMAAAWMIRDQGADVHIFEPGSRLGGINNSIEWNGHWLDMGCHLFGNETPESTNLLLDMCGHKVIPVQPNFHSRLNDHITPELEMPDLSRCDEVQAHQALGELITVALSGHDICTDNMQDWMVSRFGNVTTDLLSQSLFKMTRIRDWSQISVKAAPALPVGRVILAPSQLAQQLKSIPEIDKVLAQSWNGNPMRFHGHTKNTFPARAFYPAQGGMGGFTHEASLGLDAKGVVTHLGSAVIKLERKGKDFHLSLENGDHIIAHTLVWTAGLTALAQAQGQSLDMSGLIQNTPMVLVYFETEAPAPGATHYGADYSPDTLLFRASCPTAWANGVSPEGKGYLCCEVPTDMGSDVWENPDAHVDRVWQEALQLEMAKGERPES